MYVALIMKASLLKSTRTKASSSVCLEQMERAAMPMAGIFRPPPPSTYAPPSPSPCRLPPIRRGTTRIRSSGSIKSEPTSSTTITKTATTEKLTCLDGWLWELDGGRFRVLVDPLLVGNLDFDGAKKTLPKDGLQDLEEDLAVVDLLLITSSLNDHCHLRTLTRLAALSPDVPVVATPNAHPILGALPFNDVTYVQPGQSTTVIGATTESEITVLATPGPVNGPPWQRPENSYMVTTTGQGQQKHSVYYEPHCMYDAGFLRERGLRADVLITPVVKQQLLASFTLVSGQEDAVELARLLRAAYVVPMSNGECDAKGLLTAIISTQGTTQVFQDLLADALPQAQVVEPTPGVPLHLHFEDDNKTSSPSSPSS